MAEAPKQTRFSYVLIPADRTKPPVQHTFEGGTDDELRELIRRYFTTGAQLTTDQRAQFAETLKAKVAENAAKSKVGADASDESTSASAAPAVADAVLEGAMDTTSFEIVPVVMPGLGNRFIGTSLYIDDAGRFKELPLNDRASRIAQRDIRGDAFMLSNHDDPALDSWERVDCTVADFEALYNNPPQATLDTSNQAAMMQAALARDSIARAVTPEDAARALEARQTGNAAFTAGNVAAALAAYTQAIDLTAARTDLLPNAAEVLAARLASLLNRAQCHLNQGNWSAAERDCEVVIAADPNSLKAHFRLARAAGAQKDFDKAMKHLDRCEQISGHETAELRDLRSELTAAQQQFQQSQKKMFKKMFA